MVQTWRVRTAEPLAGQTVLIEGLQNTMTDALVHVAFVNGNTWTARLTPSQPSAAIPASQSAWTVFGAYVRHGVEHIWLGFDHLLFVACLMLIVRDWRKLVKAITAFTVAHSITLTCATLQWATLPPRPVETMIAVSIVLVAAEVVRMERGQLSLTIARPWVVAFAFGLLHGFGFAGALVELGLPQGEIPLALLSFNIGVEFGQLAFIAVLLSALYCVRWLVPLPRQASGRFGLFHRHRRGVLVCPETGRDAFIGTYTALRPRPSRRPARSFNGERDHAQEFHSDIWSCLPRRGPRDCRALAGGFVNNRCGHVDGARGE